MILFKKKTAPALSEALADRMLENIFDACQAEPNTIPLKTLISYTRYRRERFSFQKILLVVILLLFCLLPLLFLYPGVSLQLQPTDTPWLPTYRIDVDTLLPVSSVYAEVDGARLLVAAAGENTYSVEPRANGTLSVTVTLINNQYQTVTVPVSDVDTEAPACSSHSQKDGKVWLTLEDSDSGVDYSSITALDQDGRQAAPLQVDEAGQTAVFSCPEHFLDVCVPDRAGNTLHLRITMK